MSHIDPLSNELIDKSNLIQVLDLFNVVIKSEGDDTDRSFDEFHHWQRNSMWCVVTVCRISYINFYDYLVCVMY